MNEQTKEELEKILDSNMDIFIELLDESHAISEQFLSLDIHDRSEALEKLEGLRVRIAMVSDMNEEIRRLINEKV